LVRRIVRYPVVLPHNPSNIHIGNPEKFKNPQAHLRVRNKPVKHRKTLKLGSWSGRNPSNIEKPSSSAHGVRPKKFK